MEHLKYDVCFRGDCRCVPTHLIYLLVYDQPLRIPSCGAHYEAARGLGWEIMDYEHQRVAGWYTYRGPNYGIRNYGAIIASV